jgi:acyl-CoA reductase-like NAD-dependent aldehyde dehydrogenase
MIRTGQFYMSGKWVDPAGAESADIVECHAIAAQLRTDMVHLNGAALDSKGPFGGYKISGNGREWGVYGLHEFLEVNSVYGGASGSEEINREAR